MLSFRWDTHGKGKLMFLGCNEDGSAQSVGFSCVCLSRQFQCALLWICFVHWKEQHDRNFTLILISAVSLFMQRASSETMEVKDLPEVSSVPACKKYIKFVLKMISVKFRIVHCFMECYRERRKWYFMEEDRPYFYFLTKYPSRKDSLCLCCGCRLSIWSCLLTKALIYFCCILWKVLEILQLFLVVTGTWSSLNFCMGLTGSHIDTCV